MKSTFACLFVVTIVVPLAAQEPKKGVSNDFEVKVRPVLVKYCLGCHGQEKPRAEFRIGKLNPDLVNGPDAERWHEVLNVLNSGEMPPKSRPRPTDKERDIVTGWLTVQLKRAHEAKRSTGGRVVMRRLTKYEYNYTLQDLLGVGCNHVQNMPSDRISEDGFKNNGSLLSMSPAQFEMYLTAAERALGKAIVDGSRPKLHKTHLELEKATKGGKKKNKAAVTATPTGVILKPGGNFSVSISKRPREGVFRLQFRVGGQAVDGRYPQMRVELGYQASGTVFPKKILAEIEVKASQEKPEVVEFTGYMEDFPQLSFGLKDSPRYQKAGALRIWVSNVAARGKDRTLPALFVDSLDFAGPILSSWPPESHKKWLNAADKNVKEDDYARDVLQRFMKQAYRRPVSEAEVSPAFRMYKLSRSKSAPLEESIRSGMSLVLVSPKFLYLAEPGSADKKPRKLTGYELASRLSYFLWSSMPDEELFHLAENKTLLEPEVIRKQVRRMLQDAKSRRFVKHFTNQWLELDGLEQVSVNEDLRNDMRRESESFVAEVLYKDLNSLAFLKSDFAMLNSRLAGHYGIKNVYGVTLRPVAIKPEDHRGGILTQASVIACNSEGDQSHPIKRGVWLLERMLNDPPPPPPPNVPQLDQINPKFAKLPLKRQLEVHREHASCASCHAKIDPWGLAFENYNGYGQWRTALSERNTNTKRKKKNNKQQKKVSTQAVSAETVLPDGHKISGMEALQTYLLAKKKAQFAEALTRRVLSYSLGRSLEWTDRKAVTALVDDFRTHDYRLSRLIEEIALSEPFQTK